MTSPVPKKAPSRTLVMVALVLLLGSCRSRVVEELPGEDRLLEELMEEYVAERLRFYPVEATRAGLPGGDDLLGSFSRVDIERRVASLADFHRKLLGLKLEALSQPAYLDAVWLTSLAKSEILELEEIRLWERTARFYAEPIRAGLTSLLLDPDVASRTSALAGRLDAIPTLLEQARENLDPSAGLWREDGLAALELCRELLADLPQLLADRVPAYRVAELAERSRAATRALQSLMNALRVPVTAGDEGFRPLGAGVLERHFLYGEMVDAAAAELLVETLEAVAAKTDELTTLALGRFDGEPLRSLVARREIPADVREVVESAEAKARAFAQSLELGKPFPLSHAVPVVTVARYFVAPDALRLFRPAALEPVKGPFLIVDVGAAAIGTGGLELGTLGEVAVRARQYAHQAESTSLLRRVFSTSTTTEGVLAWSRSRLLDRGYGEDDPGLALRELHDSLLELVRLAAVIELHTGVTTLDEAARRFAARAFLPPEAARAEAKRAALRLDVASAGLGRLELERLEEDYRRAHPLEPEPTFVSRLLAEGPLPFRLLRFRLLNAEPGT